MITSQFSNPIFCALDTPDPVRAGSLAQSLSGEVGGLKIGLEYFAAQGPGGIDAIRAAGLPLFLDVKLHDIPNTVAGAIRSITPLAPAMVTLHAAGGFEMLKRAGDAAREAADKANVPAPLLIGVTVLTSLDADDLKEIGVEGPVEAQTLRLAHLACKAGLDGIVCSPLEVGPMRSALGPDILLVVPGIRPASSAADDQKRVTTPKDAIAAGANILVIGRPITASENPVAAARAIAGEIA